MDPRLRRLANDHRQLMTAFAGHPAVAIRPLGPVPPERYRIVYAVPSLRLTPQRQPLRVSHTTVDLMLPVGYPREKPYCTTTEPVFHPNFGAHICIADFWSPGQTLVDVVAQIGEMLQFRLYNVRSPLNAVAAQWTQDNAHQLPLAYIEVHPATVDVELISPARRDVTTGTSVADGQRVAL